MHNFLCIVLCCCDNQVFNLDCQIKCFYSIKNGLFIDFISLIEFLYYLQFSDNRVYFGINNENMDPSCVLLVINAGDDGGSGSVLVWRFSLILTDHCLK